jgi:sulfate/thiosulfate transport system permease protein
MNSSADGRRPKKLILPIKEYLIKSIKARRTIPGFKLSLGYTIFYLSLIVLIPLSMLILRTTSLTFAEFWETVTAPRTLAAYRLTFGAAFVAAFINAIFGFLIAWVLARYDFFGKKIIDAMVDLPFALPTAVAGIALTAIYAPNGWVGRYLEPMGIKAAFSPLGVVLALTFIGLPFVVRTVQPVIEELDPAIEEAAMSLGADRWQTFRKVIFPILFPPLITGFTMAFARAVGEYGSVIFISGNMPGKTEIAPLLIMTKLEQYDYAGATSIALVMLLFSFALFGAINLLQSYSSKKTGMAS